MIFTCPPPPAGPLSFWRAKIQKLIQILNRTSRTMDLTNLLLDLNLNQETGPTHHLPVESAHDVSGECEEALRRPPESYPDVLPQSQRVRRNQTHLLHVDAGLGAGLQELDPVVNGQLEESRTKH